jgi:hypothetical protein
MQFDIFSDQADSQFRPTAFDLSDQFAPLLHLRLVFGQAEFLYQELT